ncbi:MAG: hypothetical protein GW748_05755 [Alphaproteobacteria bacterium]|nr:hypothetical protein [Alphaproteobacteria bacterium]NCQ67231.1 hypothetical protein [Alphaproteobacteria bacterium]
MPVLFYALQMFLLSLLSYEDYRTKRISLWLLLMFVGFTLGGVVFLKGFVDYTVVFGILGFLILLKVGVFLGTGKSLIGNGDLILLLPLLASLDLTEFPFFLILAGLGGIVTCSLISSKRAPFVPALSLSYGIVLLVRYI